MSGGPTGLVVVDKEPGWTSHDVVARLRSVFGQRQVGHAGTLDPDATGVLLVGLGRVTRLLRFLTNLQKEYTAEVVLGTATDSLDASGVVVGEWEMSTVPIDAVRAATVPLTGRIEQIPPMVSAVKIGGRRLHELARKGIEVYRPPRQVQVDRFDVIDQVEPGVFRVIVECSSGTYIRVLAADVGTALGGGAHVRNLRRTRIGSFRATEGELIASIGPTSVRSPAEAIRDLAAVPVDADTAVAISRGLPLDRVPLGATGPGPWALVDGTGRLLAVYEATETDRIRPAVVLAAR